MGRGVGIPAAAFAVALSYAGSASAAGGDLPPILSTPPPKSAPSIEPPPESTAATETQPSPAPPAAAPVISGWTSLPAAAGAPAVQPFAWVAPPFARLRTWRVSFDVRGEVHSLFKVYDAGADAGGGGGVAADLDVARYAAPDPASPVWGGVAFGLGLAMHYDAWAIGGVDASVLGARSVASGVTSFFEVEPSLFFGGRLGIGSFTGPTAWRGVILGATWAPTYVYFSGTSRFGGGGAMHPAGLRLTADIGTLDGARESREAIFRLTLTWLPHINDLPTILTLGGGAAFY